MTVSGMLLVIARSELQRTTRQSLCSGTLAVSNTRIARHISCEAVEDCLIAKSLEGDRGTSFPSPVL